MKYNIGDLLKDEDENNGMVCIKWNDGDLCALENDAAHPNPIKVGHWPEVASLPSVPADAQKSCDVCSDPAEGSFGDYCRHCGRYLRTA